MHAMEVFVPLWRVASHTPYTGTTALSVAYTDSGPDVPYQSLSMPPAPPVAHAITGILSNI